MTKYERHIRQLCRKHSIEIRFVQRDCGANMSYKIIWIPTSLKSVKTYAIALHEVGHILNENRSLNKNWFKVMWARTRGENVPFASRYQMECEIKAWHKAQKLSKWWNDTADKVMIDSIFTYIFNYNYSHKKPFIGMRNKHLKEFLDFKILSNRKDTQMFKEMLYFAVDIL